MIEAGKPGVFLFVCGAGFTGQVFAVQCQCAATSAATDHVLKNRVHDINRAFVGQAFHHAFFRRLLSACRQQNAIRFRCVAVALCERAFTGVICQLLFAVAVAKYGFRCLVDNGAIRFLDGFNQIRFHVIAAVGDNGEAARQLHWRELACPQGERQVGWHVGGRDLQLIQIVQCLANAQISQQPD